MEFLNMLWVFFRIGVVSFGGGWTIVGLIRTEVLAQGWLSAAQFSELLTIVQITPGPIALNTATLIGWQLYGLPGALAATFSVIAAPLMLISTGLLAVKKISLDLKKMQAIVRIASAGLLVMTLYHLAITADPVWQSAVIAAAAFILAAFTRINPLWIILGAGGLNLLISFLGRVL